MRRGRRWWPSKSSYRYVGQQALVDTAYRQVVRRSQRYPYFGYRKIYDLRRDSWTISRERVRLILPAWDWRSDLDEA